MGEGRPSKTVEISTVTTSQSESAKLLNVSRESVNLAEISGKLSQTEASSMVKVSPDSISFAKKVQSQGWLI